MNFGTYENHSTIFHILFHGSSKCSLSLFGEFFSLVNNQHFELFGILRSVHIVIGCYLLNYILNNMSVMMLIIRRSNLNMIITLKYGKFNSN